MDKEFYRPNYLKNIIITLIIIAVVASFSYFVVIRQINYNLGEDFYLARLYDDAIIKLRPLGNYKDSKSLYIRSLYRQGLLYYEAYNYLMAIEKFEELSEVLPETDILITDSKYMMGILEGVNERYDECLSILTALDGYSKSDVMIEAAINRQKDPFVTEHRTHIIALDFRTVIQFYLNSK